PVNADMEANPSGASLSLSLPTGSFSFVRGGFTALKLMIPEGTVQISDNVVAIASGKADEVDLTRSGHAPAVLTLRRLQLNATDIEKRAAPIGSIRPTGAITVGALSGQVLDSSLSADMANSALSGLSVPAAVMSFGGTHDQPAITGTGTLAIS